MITKAFNFPPPVTRNVKRNHHHHQKNVNATPTEIPCQIILDKISRNFDTE